MAFKLDPHVWETSTTTGTGALTLAGTVLVPALDATDMASRRFGDFLANGDTTWYQARNRSVPAEWEEGIGTWNTGHTLTRTTVLNSSNADAAVSFSAGTKDVICGFPAGAISDSGRQWLGSTDMVYDGDKLGLGITPTEKLHVDGSALIEQTLGTELVTNGTFTGSATGWTLGAGWAYGTNNVAHTAGNTAALSQTIMVVAGKRYFVTFTPVSGTAGTVTIGLGGDSEIRAGDNLDPFVRTFDAISTAGISFTPTTDYDGVIDDVSVKELVGGVLTFKSETYPSFPYVRLAAGVRGGLNTLSIDVGSSTYAWDNVIRLENDSGEAVSVWTRLEVEKAVLNGNAVSSVSNNETAAGNNESQYLAKAFGDANTGSARLDLNVHADGSNDTVASIYLDGNAGAAGQTVIDSPNGTLFNQLLVMGAVLRKKGYTVATLPAGTAGDEAFVTDALAPAYRAAVVGGGAVHAPVEYNGAAWVVS